MTKEVKPHSRPLSCLAVHHASITGGGGFSQAPPCSVSSPSLTWWSKVASADIALALHATARRTGTAGAPYAGRSRLAAVR